MADETSMPTPVPVVQPEVKVFWDATAEGKLLLPKCSDCATLIWFPRPFCPSCGSLSIDWSQSVAARARSTATPSTVAAPATCPSTASRSRTSWRTSSLPRGRAS